MADKKPAKKEAPPAPNGHDYLWKFIVGGLLIFALISSLTVSKSNNPGTSGSTDVSGQNAVAQNLASNDSFLSFISSPQTSTFPTAGDIKKDSEVVVERKTVVRVEPGGPIIGTQKVGAKGKVVGGPVVVDGVRYFAVHFENVPDGWVRESDITTHTTIFSIINFIPAFFGVIHTIASVIAFLLGIAVIVVAYKNRKVNYPPENAEDEKEEEIAALPVQDERWKRVTALLESHNHNDWRQAIIEADIMLDEMLEHMKYQGPGVADKLKQIEPSDFLTLDDAWEAHKVRNRIAHQGNDYALGQAEARRIIGLYEKVFKEFYFI